MTHTYSVAALSWIDPRARLPKSDDMGNPGPIIQRQLIVGRNRYRFANFLEAFVEVNAAGKITKHGFTKDSKIYYNTSAYGTKPFIYPTSQRAIRTANKVTFTQLVGCRTEAPEKIGGLIGEVGLGPIGPIGEDYSGIGKEIGGALVGKIISFPPIWSHLELVINANGQHRFRVIRHSLFPSMSTYSLVSGRANFYIAQGNYDGVPNYDFWRRNGWEMTAARPLVGKGNPGNPWGVHSPLVPQFWR